MATGPNEQKRRYRQYADMVTGSSGDKSRYRQYKARTERLPANYHAAIVASRATHNATRSNK